MGGLGPWGAASRGASVKKSAAIPVSKAHCENNRRSVSPRVSAGNGPSSGHWPEAARASLLAR